MDIEADDCLVAENRINYVPANVINNMFSLYSKQQYSQPDTLFIRYSM